MKKSLAALIPATLIPVCAFLFLVTAFSPAAAQTTSIVIGTGGVTGVYYPAGGAICRMINKGRKQHNVRCSVVSTGGSVDNINAIRAGDLELGVVQSDVQAAALDGKLEFSQDGPFPGLRALFSLHAEPLHLVARRDSGIRMFEDIKGKRVNIGNPGSGQRATTMQILDDLGWSMDDFAKVTEFKSADQSAALCGNEIDAVFFTVGIPSGALKETATACDTVIVPMSGDWVDTFIAERPAYAKAIIPGGTYRGTDKDVPTFGPKATLVTSETLPDDIAYQTVKAVFDNVDVFRRLHPAFVNLTAEGMSTDGLAAPLHEGAARYFKESGMR